MLVSCAHGAKIVNGTGDSLLYILGDVPVLAEQEDSGRSHKVGG